MKKYFLTVQGDIYGGTRFATLVSVSEQMNIKVNGAHKLHGRNVYCIVAQFYTQF
jgi:hypothetical protein